MPIFTPQSKLSTELETPSDRVPRQEMYWGEWGARLMQSAPSDLHDSAQSLRAYRIECDRFRADYRTHSMIHQVFDCDGTVLQRALAYARTSTNAIATTLMCQGNDASPAFGFHRVGDELIAFLMLQKIEEFRQSSPNARLRILEIGAGSSSPLIATRKENAGHYGAPWLSRAFSLAFPEDLECYVSDLAGPLQSSIECALFGVSGIHSPLSFFELGSRPLGEFDLIFARHVEPFLSSNPQRLAFSIGPSLSERGFGIVMCDGLLHRGTHQLTLDRRHWLFKPYDPAEPPPVALSFD